MAEAGPPRVVGVFDARGRADRMEALFAPMMRRLAAAGLGCATLDAPAGDPAARVLRVGSGARGAAPGDGIARAAGRVVCGAARLYGPAPGDGAADLARLAEVEAAGGFDRLHVGAAPVEGDYVCAICDPAGPDGPLLTLLRDPFGQAPLHWRRDPDGVVAFATWPHALLALPGAPAEPDPDDLEAWMHFRRVPGGRTIWPGLHDAPRGAALRFGREAAPPAPFWRPGPCADLAGAAATEALEAAGARLRAAVLQRRDRLGGDPAVMFSGGLDSSLVAGALCEAAAPGAAVAAFASASGAGRFPRERAARDAMARRWPALLISEVGPEGLDPLAGADAAWSEHAAPNADPTFFNTQALLGRMAGAGASACLTGMGGDLLVSAGLRAKLAEDLRRLRLRDAAEAWRAERFRGARRPETVLRAAEALGGGAALRRLRLSLIGEDPLAAALAPRRLAARRADLTGPGMDLEERATASVLEEEVENLLSLPEGVLSDLDVALAPAGGAARHMAVAAPLLDTRLAAAVMAAPASLKTQGGRHRALARALLAPIAPPEVAARRDKAPFQPDLLQLWTDAARRAAADFPEMATRPLWRELVEADALRHRLARLERMGAEPRGAEVLEVAAPLILAWFLGAFLRRLEG